jgi:hypothetical protein
MRRKIDEEREIAWLTIPGFRIDLIQVDLPRFSLPIAIWKSRFHTTAS